MAGHFLRRHFEKYSVFFFETSTQMLQWLLAGLELLVDLCPLWSGRCGVVPGISKTTYKYFRKHVESEKVGAQTWFSFDWL